jgi:hypothetical protein
MVFRMGSTNLKHSRGNKYAIGRAEGHSKRYIGDSGIAEHAGAQQHQLNRAQSDKEVIHTPGISPETAKSHTKRMMVRRHVHPTKTRKDTLAADHFVEPLLISRTAAYGWPDDNK